jgi:hypothetical protein
MFFFDRKRFLIIMISLGALILAGSLMAGIVSFDTTENPKDTGSSGDVFTALGIVCMIAAGAAIIFSSFPAYALSERGGEDFLQSHGIIWWISSICSMVLGIVIFIVCLAALAYPSGSEGGQFDLWVNGYILAGSLMSCLIPCCLPCVLCGELEIGDDDEDSSRIEPSRDVRVNLPEPPPIEIPLDGPPVLVIDGSIKEVNLEA